MKRQLTKSRAQCVGSDTSPECPKLLSFKRQSSSPDLSEDLAVVAQIHREAFQEMTGIGEDESSIQGSTFTHPTPSETKSTFDKSTLEKKATEDFLTLDEADSFLAYFQKEMSPYFPFVMIAAHLDARIIARKNPFLLLAILTIATGEQPDLQRSLDREFCKVLATKVMVNGERSLEILQGLLIYIAW
jgi:hypothetical protein